MILLLFLFIMIVILYDFDILIDKRNKRSSSLSYFLESLYVCLWYNYVIIKLCLRYVITRFSVRVEYRIQVRSEILKK